MPVNILLCEGGPGSPDIRVLAKLLTGLVEVRAFGGKYGMGNRILSRREALGGDVVFGLLDGDFKEWSPPTNLPNRWAIDGNKIHIGWRWDRKEIENYLIDPMVVSKTTKTPISEYKTVLCAAALSIGPYQAARIALSLNRLRFSPMPNLFDKTRGASKHSLPDIFEENVCLEAAKQIVTNWNEGRCVDMGKVESDFNRVLPECAAGGSRCGDYLCGFAGKDLLWAMEEGLKTLGFSSPSLFLEKILSGLEASTEDLASWLPEWSALREQVANQP